MISPGARTESNLRRRKARLECPAARPRASATAVPGRCMPSAPTGAAGRRPLRVPMPTTCTSTTAGSIRGAAPTVRTAFSCVASRDRKKETLAKKKQPSSAEQHPAPGFRSYQYGTLSGIGYAGFVWSATIPTGSGYAHHLRFFSGGFYPQNDGSRSYGFPLRCLQE